MNMKQITKQIKNHLDKAQKIAIVGHLDPDGDSLGSMTAMAEYLINIGKKPYLFSFAPVEKKLDFLPQSENFSHDEKIFVEKKIETIVVLDSGDLKRVAMPELVKDLSTTIINIDHHITNDNFGHLNLVLPNASSTAEIIYLFLYHNNIKINHRMATALLTGIITDTDNFSNSATSVSAINIAGELVRLGGNLSLINKRVTKDKTVNSLKLWGVILSRLNKIEKKNLVYTYVTKKDLEKYNLKENQIEGIANFLNNLDEAGICLLLKETDDGKIKGSLRTTKNDIDVADIARQLGGGGHKKAAGFTTTLKMEEIVDLILKME